MRNKRQFWPGQIRRGCLLAVFAVPLLLSMRAFAPFMPLPFQLSISGPDSDSFVVITASSFSVGEYYQLNLQVSTNLTAANWVNIQTNYISAPGPSYFSYKVTRAQGPVFFRVAGILN
jgi:hypothetical protein